MDFTSVFSGKFQVNGLARTPGQVGVSLALQTADPIAKYFLSAIGDYVLRLPSGARRSVYFKLRFCDALTLLTK